MRRRGYRVGVGSPSRVLFWALIGLIGFGIVTIFVQIPNGAMIYAILGPGDLRRPDGLRLPALNVFLLLLSLFGGRED